MEVIQMKQRVFWTGMLCMAMLPGWVSAEVRDFTTRDGQTVKGEIQEYSLKTDKVTIRQGKGKSVQLKAAALSDNDFIYVRDWDAVRRFAQNTDFRIYLNDAVSMNKWTKYIWRRPPGKVEPYITWKTDFNRLSYQIKFENQTEYDLENVEIKYCIFYRQERMDYRIEEKVNDLVVRPCLHRFAIVPDGQNKKFNSRSIVLRRHEIAGAGNNLEYLEGDGRFLKSKLVGMVFRASIKTASGHSTVREIRLPKGLSEEYVWVEPSPENTRWPDDGLDEREETQRPPTLFEEMGGSDDE